MQGGTSASLTCRLLPPTAAGGVLCCGDAELGYLTPPSGMGISVSVWVLDLGAGRGIHHKALSY